MEVAPLSCGENPGGVADKHPPGGHHVDCENFDDLPINSNEGGEQVGKKSHTEGVGCSEGAVLPFQSLQRQISYKSCGRPYLTVHYKRPRIRLNKTC